MHGLQRKGVPSTHVCPICRKTLPPNTVDVLVADAYTLRVRADYGDVNNTTKLRRDAAAKLRDAVAEAMTTTVAILPLRGA